MIQLLFCLLPLHVSALTPKGLLHAKSFRKVVVGKRDYYVSSGLFFGGDVVQEDWTLKSVRHGKHAGFQRLALEWNQSGVPYFQVALPEDGRFVQISVWGRSQFAESARSYLKSLDAWLKPLDGFDQVFWSSFLPVKAGSTMEVFLTEMHPILVIDVREGLPRANSSTP